MATWRSLLCQGGWTYPMVDGNYILFNEDGTGEVCTHSITRLTHLEVLELLNYIKLHCGVAPAAFICAKLIWKPIDDISSEVLQQPIRPVDSDTELVQISIDIEITLSKGLPERSREWTLPDINEENLTPPAFQPKTYNLQMALGEFTADQWFYFDNPLQSAENKSMAKEIEHWNKFRVVFDKSPYPPLEEWVEQKNGVDRAIRMYKFWEFRDFYRGIVLTG